MSDATYQAWSLSGINAYRTRGLVKMVAQVYGAHPLMRAFVSRQILDPAGVAPHDTLGAVRAIFAWVRDEVRFLLEHGEQVLTPGRVLLWRLGDCDDRSGLVAAMLQSIRVPWRLKLLARQIGGRLRPYHIWPQALVGGEWIDLETSDPRARFGEHPSTLTRRVSGVQL